MNANKRGKRMRSMEHKALYATDIGIMGLRGAILRCWPRLTTAHSSLSATAKRGRVRGAMS